MGENKNAIDARELEQAFSLFNLASEQLAATYAGLQRQVVELTQQLAIANGELKRQYLEKEALSSRLTALLAALPAGVVVVDADERVIEANPAAGAMLGEPMLGSAWSEIEGRALRATATPGEWENAANRRLACSTSPLETAGGRILLFHDITEAHRLQQELARHQRLSAMGEVAARLAHQLRTPLATALLYASQWSQPHLNDADRARFSEKVVARLSHLEHLIQDMLLYVRGEVGARQRIVVEELLGDLRQVMEPQMAARGVAFSVYHEAGDAAVAGSRDAIGGALLNLLENALQWTPVGGSVALRSTAVDGAVSLTVTDSGPGIGPEAVERLFEPFYTTRQEGTGLGLAIVRSVAEAHGGAVTVDSIPGRGASFTLRLPELEMG